MKVARNDQRGADKLGNLAQYVPYSHLVLSNRMGSEHPAALKELAAQRPPGQTMIYYSPVDAVPDWPDGEPWHYERAWSRTVDAFRLWLPLPLPLRAVRGRIPEIESWRGSMPIRYAVNVTDRNFGLRFAECVTAGHEEFEAAAGMRLGLWIDNVWDRDTFPGRLSTCDADKDGAQDNRADLEASWEDGMREALWRLTGSPVVLNTTRATYARYGTGAWVEAFGVLRQAPRSSRWRKPTTHFIQSEHTAAARLSALAYSLLFDDVVPAEDSWHYENERDNLGLPVVDWIDEYNLELGNGAVYADGVTWQKVDADTFVREYERGRVTWNAATGEGKVVGR